MGGGRKGYKSNPSFIKSPLKVIFCVLSAIAFLGIAFAFVLNLSTKSEIFKADLVLKNATKNGEIFSYHFIINAPKFAPLLRSKRISSVEILRISWSAEIAGKTQNLRTKNIRIWVDSTQDLAKLTQNAESIGVVEYKISFNPLIKSIAKYYVAILSLMAFAIFFRTPRSAKGKFEIFSPQLILRAFLYLDFCYILSRYLRYCGAMFIISMIGGAVFGERIGIIFLDLWRHFWHKR
ncbi:hypothetical protein ACWIUD_02515 [Helicobacter sp. 23-1044]